MANLIEQEKKKPPFEVALYDASLKEQFLKLTDDKAYTEETFFALQQLRKNDVLQKCSPASIRLAILNVALTHTTLNPVLQRAYLIPRKGECCLDFSYKGLIKMITDAGTVKSIEAAVVYDFDDFDYELGTSKFLKHKPNMTPPIDTEEVFQKHPLKIWEYVKCAYSIATLFDGTMDFVILPKWKLWKTYQGSQAKGVFSPWQTYPDEQLRKTPLRYHTKTLPQSDKIASIIGIMNDTDGLEIETNASKLEAKFTEPETAKPDCNQCQKYDSCEGKPSADCGFIPLETTREELF